MKGKKGAIFIVDMPQNDYFYVALTCAKYGQMVVLGCVDQ